MGEQLRQKYEEKLRQAREEIVEEVLVKKDIGKKISQEQLWKMFLTWCEEELPHDVSYQKKLLGDAFQYFLQKKCTQEDNYLQSMDEECNQIIREDLLK
jgi:hypothetical protein